ncbi:WavE lipopolysaccharide synthesis family protein [Butyrivibrio sp. AE3003]|uniref:WavE lipopolysaccharide synthesis family protein n=1 Tax=Butyrivibrio sp. AE3003 TaxID=1496721 RepID=UPI000691C330|nr:WavE lipopolysaccharide synthesis family protein [Butyrivibrio sp. AE3003]
MISVNEISIVVQGAITSNKTRKCLLSVRKILPDAELILSTWEGMDVAGLEYDKVIFSSDPGGNRLFQEDEYTINNVNRQILSTNAGIKATSKKYVIKMRTDFELISNKFLRIYEKYDKVYSSYSFFSHPIICCELFSRNPRVKYAPFSVCFHPSDIFYFGLKDDLEELFSIPLYNCKETELLNLLFNGTICLFPEQYIWTCYLRKKNPELLSITDNAILMNVNEELLAMNFIVLSNNQIGIRSLKKEIYKSVPIHNCYSHLDWVILRLSYSRKKGGGFLLYMLKVKMLSVYYMFLSKGRK